MSKLLTELASCAVERVRKFGSESNDLLRRSAWADLHMYLNRWLTTLLNPAIASEIAVVATTKQPAALDRALLTVRSFADLNKQQFFRLLPAAEETIERVIGDWIRAQLTTLARLRRDRGRLISIVPRTGRHNLLQIMPGLSDPHDCGQTVTILQFANGTRVVYKPRSCEGEQIWFSALHWLNENAFDPAFYIPKLIPRGKYSWMSFVDHRPCRSKEAVRRLYFRWGAQAAVAQLLGCADLHRQNWIAAGEQPVLVDADMLGDRFSKHDRTDPLRRLHPLLQTGLLPIFKSDGVGRYEGIAPFDSRSLRKERNVFWPIYKGRTERPHKYIDEIVDGFVSVSRFICDRCNRKAFGQFVNRAARRKNLRILKRATLEYRQILKESLHPRYLQARGDRLKYLLDRCGRDPTGRAESRALLRCSVPRLTSKTQAVADGRHLADLIEMLDSTRILRSRL